MTSSSRRITVVPTVETPPPTTRSVAARPSASTPRTFEELCAECALVAARRLHPECNLTWSCPRANQIALVAKSTWGTLGWFILQRICGQIDTMSNVNLICISDVRALHQENLLVASPRLLQNAVGEHSPVIGVLPPGAINVVFFSAPQHAPITLAQLKGDQVLSVPCTWVVLDERHLVGAPLLGTEVLQAASAGIFYRSAQEPLLKYADRHDATHSVPLTYTAPPAQGGGREAQ